MKRMLKTFLIATLGLLAATPVVAAGHWQKYGRVVDRFERQDARIEQGVDSGELTRREARILQKEQHRIRRLANELYEDDGLSRRDRRILHEELDRASDRIYRFKHNDDHRHRVHRSYRYRIGGDNDGEWPRYGYIR